MTGPRVALGAAALLFALAACEPIVPNDAATKARPHAPPPDVSALQNSTIQSQPLGSADPNAPLPSSVIAAVNAAPDNNPDAPASSVEVAGPKVPLDQSSVANPTLLTGTASADSSGSASDSTTTNATTGGGTRTASASATTGSSSKPSGSSSGGVSRLVSFARSTKNKVGQKAYARPGDENKNAFYRACAAYSSQDAAQTAFLNAGGPTNDPLGVDPDGDGFACYWDPTPYRSASK